MFPIKQQISQNFQLHPFCRHSVNWRKVGSFWEGNLDWLCFWGGHSLGSEPSFLFVGLFNCFVAVFFVLFSFSFRFVMNTSHSASLSLSLACLSISLCVFLFFFPFFLFFFPFFLPSLCSVFFFCFLVLGFVLLAPFLCFSFFLPRFVALPS